MSWQTARAFRTGSEVLYRAVITYTHPEFGSRTRYIGPYTTAGPAKAFITRERNWGTDVVVDGHVERCQPQWERLPAEEGQHDG